jgi:hypothetical protein
MTGCRLEGCTAGNTGCPVAKATAGTMPASVRKPHAEAVQDRRFAEAIYRIAIADGIMEGVT